MCLKTENDNNDSDKKNDSQKKNVFAFNLHFGFIYDLTKYCTVEDILFLFHSIFQFP